MDIREILELHQKWLNGEPDGERASLRGANLIGADLSKANLYGADLRKAYLIGAGLSGADLSGADFYGAKGIIHIQLEGYDMWIQSHMSKIGCQYLSNKDWQKVTANQSPHLAKKNTPPHVYEAYKILFNVSLEALKLLEKEEER